MEAEIAYWPEHYGDLEVPVFAPHFYYPLSKRKDEYSRKIVFGKKTDLSDYFLDDMKKVFSKLPFKPDLLIIVPASKVRAFSPTIVGLGKKLSKIFDVPFRKSIRRVEERTKLTNCITQEERYASISGAFRVTRKLKGERVVLIDDTRVSGVTLLECAKMLKKAGASEVTAVCLGINM
jgi:predicted amidophosphoribosyltransferase